MIKSIIKYITAILIVSLMLVSMTSCNKDIFDTVLTFDYAILKLPDGSIIEGEVESWTDYEDGDQIQVKIDGTYYLVHSVNIVLSSKD